MGFQAKRPRQPREPLHKEAGLLPAVGWVELGREGKQRHQREEEEETEQGNWS